MQYHPYSEIFPLLEGVAFDELVTDIKTHGLREKIWLYEGKILDGRNRFLACKKAGITPETRKYTGADPLGFVWSVNRHRRHLTPSQLAMAAAKLATLAHGQKKADAPRGASGLTQVEAAKDAGVGRRTVQRARKVIEEGSKALQQAVEKGTVTVAKAASVVDLPKSEQLAAATREEPSEPEFTLEDYDPAKDAAVIERFEREWQDRVDKAMGADDRFAESVEQIKQQAQTIAVLTSARDHWQNQAGEAVRLLKAEKRKVASLEKKLKKLQGEEALRETSAKMQ